MNVAQKLSDFWVHNNRIEVKAMKYLSNGLKNTQVKQVAFSCCALLFLFVTKTLTTINIGDNQIGDDGIRYLTTVLQNNQVREIFYSY